MKRHPDKWVAMGQEGVLAVGESMDEVLSEVESRGLHGADVVIQFMDTDPLSRTGDSRLCRQAADETLPL